MYVEPLTNSLVAQHLQTNKCVNLWYEAQHVNSCFILRVWEEHYQSTSACNFFVLEALCLIMSQNKNHYLGITDRVPSAGFPCGSSWRVLVQIAGSSDGRGQVSDGQRSSVSQFRHRCTGPGLCPWNRNTRDSRAYSHTGKHRDEISFLSLFLSFGCMTSIFCPC